MSEATAIQAPPMNGGRMTVKQLFEQQRDKIASVVPRHMDPERLMRVALVTINRTPGLAKCTPLSLLECVMQASQLGLDCGGLLGSAYLIPFGDKCTLIIGYRGMLDLARRSGQVETIQCDVVRAGDEYSAPAFVIDRDGPRVDFKHKPMGNQAADVVAAWACAIMKGGTYQIEAMTRAEIDGIRKRSRSGNNGPWVTDFAEMCKKTIIRRLCKRLPLSPDVIEAIGKDDDADFGHGRSIVADVESSEVVAETKRRSKADAMASRLVETQDAEPVSEPVAFDATDAPPADVVPTYESIVAAVMAKTPALKHRKVGNAVEAWVLHATGAKSITDIDEAGFRALAEQIQDGNGPEIS